LALVAGLGLSIAGCSGKKSGGSATGKTTITVDCPPQKTDQGGKTLAAWNADVAAFQKLHPDVEIKSISVGSQCDNPADFTARLQGGTQADVFYGYMTDLGQVLDQGGAADITSYINSSTIPNWDSLSPSVKGPFTENGKVYGIGYAGYALGLVINKGLFTQAGLDPAKPPTTWQEVAVDAKKIAALGNGVVGYEEYSAGNTGGWHFTAELNSRGGTAVTADRKSANFNNAAGRAVLQNLHDMRFTDNSMGTKQLLQWSDLLTNAGAGKVGMYVGAPDTVTAIVTQFKGKFSDWAIGPIPGDNGPAKATLGGGSGYFFKKGDSAAQIKAGLQWVNYEELTPGQGQFNYVTQKAEGVPVGLPEPLIWVPGSAPQKQDETLKQANTNLNLADYANYVNNPVPVQVEPPQAQAVYAVLDGAMSAVLTQPNADISALLATANTKVNAILAGQGS
jgi:ABC-type glycerol-3-phosphate transport system substrate-binding protein